MYDRDVELGDEELPSKCNSSLEELASVSREMRDEKSGASSNVKEVSPRRVSLLGYLSTGAKATGGIAGVLPFADHILDSVKYMATGAYEPKIESTIFGLMIGMATFALYSNKR